MSPASTVTTSSSIILPIVSPLKAAASASAAIAYEIIPVEEIDTAFCDYVDLAVKTRGGKVLAVSDEWFAEAHNLLTPTAPISRKGHFTPKGAWFDGWETRRHGPDYDWCVIQLGYPGTIAGFEFDTAFFTGNHSPFVSVEGLVAASSEKADNGCDNGYGQGTDVNGDGDDAKSVGRTTLNGGWAKAIGGTAGPHWVPILPKVALNPDSRHGFKLAQPTTSFYTHIRFRMFPDGGAARLRVYGKVHQILPEDKAEIFDLAAVGAGGQVKAFSDAHFGHPSNLLLPGRGSDMSDGWETKRSRAPGHVDWCLIRLGVPGHPVLVEIDTAHYMGNPPKCVTLLGFTASDTLEENPVVLLDQVPVKPHKQHIFSIPEPISANNLISTIKVVMIPDGGIKRVRVFGSQSWPAHPIPETSSIGKTQPLPDEHTWNLLTIQAEPITKAAFEPWGQVIEVPLYDPNAIKVNQGTAQKFSHIGHFANWRSYALNEEAIQDQNKLMMENSNNSQKKCLDRPYPANIVPATANIAIFQCYKPIETQEIGVRLLERHPYSSQMFVPMGGDGNGGFVVVVAKDQEGSEGRIPDLTTLKAFTVKNSQGVNYKPNVWHHPMIVTDRPVTFLTITNESGVGKDDCEEYWFKKEAEAVGSEGGVAAIVRL
ncbi:Allantoicase [Lobosporangium transversale]|uniref:Galactose-binding domain-like protein n=1 Tax=Lobosporangium transversale TaxID=64571 RepID=A0A1Y2GLR3_9FUNG|nr:galactose-binding domain-like protein [Lobosporangium transversale]KAF9899493.1 Allantoicase [Lobosporangium transversale]ORZ12595.1 galactose-binding domain-like protein [Lobosporangium transversale]|eukprot:XP_021880214.1 galactose-binding domain-like protein [Lobosporangium transversale]